MDSSTTGGAALLPQRERKKHILDGYTVTNNNLSGLHDAARVEWKLIERGGGDIKITRHTKTRYPTADKRAIRK